MGQPVPNDRFEPLTIQYWRHRMLRRVVPNAVALAAAALVTAIYLLWQLVDCCCHCCRCAKGPKARGDTP